MSKQKGLSRVRRAYKFIDDHRDQFGVNPMCRALGVSRAGYYEWLEQPVSDRAHEDARLFQLIRASFIASHGIYGAPRVFLDLREAGETCSKHRVMRLMRENGLRALHGYRTRRVPVGKPAVLIPNILKRRFTVSRPNEAWVTDITYIRTWQGLALPGGRHGSLLSQDRGLGDQTHDPSTFSSRSGGPSRPPKAPSRHCRSLRPRDSIR